MPDGTPYIINWIVERTPRQIIFENKSTNFSHLSKHSKLCYWVVDGEVRTLKGGSPGSEVYGYVIGLYLAVLYF